MTCSEYTVTQFLIKVATSENRSVRNGHALNIAFYEQSVNIKCGGNSNLCQYYKNFTVREKLSVHFLPSGLYGGL